MNARTDGRHASIIRDELRRHAPFTMFGSLTGIFLLFALIRLHTPTALLQQLFWTFHPLHVLFSAVATASMFRIHGRGGLVRTVAVGYLGSVGIATLSDCLIPYVGEWMLEMPHPQLHLGFIEKWWLVNPLALAGIALGYLRPATRLPHAAHVLLSTWSSLFHMSLAGGTELPVASMFLVGVFLFLAVWVPCCTSDIVFPLLVVGKRSHPADD